jgi:hypothetical protein
LDLEEHPRVRRELTIVAVAIGLVLHDLASTREMLLEDVLHQSSLI